jgi:Ca2+-binding EF-hand superfamily protein
MIAWGVKLTEKQLQAAFKTVDTDGGGKILFREFADWAINQNLDLEDDDDVDNDFKPIPPDPNKPKKTRKQKKHEIKMAKFDWANLANKLPTGKDPESAAARKKVFNQFDPNGNGYLSLAEVDRGMVILELDEVLSKPVLIRAHNAAKNYTGAGDGPDADFVTKREFRILLMYLRQYAELYHMFDAVDSDDDGRITPEEFDASTGKIMAWGIKCTEEKLKASFGEIDTDGGGTILFKEFADWAIKHNLDLEDDDEVDDDFNPVAVDPEKAKAAKAARKAKEEQKKSEFKGEIDYKMLEEKLPTGDDAESKKTRKELWKMCDPNGNGYVSLAELDKCIHDLSLDGLLDKPCLIRAFNAAKHVHKLREKRAEAEDYVEKDEFKWLMMYLHKYAKLWEMFQHIDKDGDRRVDKAELEASVINLNNWGISVEKEEIGSVFSVIDTDGGGKILFVEFADWAIQNNLDLVTDQATQMFNLVSGKGVHIKLEQMVDALRGMGHNPTAKEIATYDTNKDGKISMEEFIKVCQKIRRPAHAKTPNGENPMIEDMMKLLAHFDKDNSGHLSPDEVQKFMCSSGDKLTKEECSALLAELDTNNDGKISLREFAVMLAEN